MVTLLNNQFSKKGTERDNAFNWYYAAVNIGGLIAPIITGYLRPRYGFEFVFMIAGVALALSMIGYLFNKKYFIDKPKEEEIKETNTQHSLAATIILCITSLLFWSVFHLNNGYMTLYAEKKVGHILSPEYLQTINPLCIFLFTFIYVHLHKKYNFNFLKRFKLGLLLCSIAFIPLIIFISSPLFSISAMYVIISAAELIISPGLLNVVSDLAPEKRKSMMVGFYQFCVGISYKIAGLFGIVSTILTEYQFFMLMALIPFSGFILIMLFSKKIKPIFD